ncbi:MAG TPA: hypothetical protein VGI90_09700 [Steroidobacteraceae bacterium]|jgi:hypothetical protein
MLPADHGPWNPGVESQTPGELRHLATIFRPENVFTSFAAATELRGLTGFDLNELVAFRPQRLALHELLVRITADFAVPDGTRIEDLGLNFREIARLLLSRYLEPAMDSIVEVYRRSRDEAEGVIESALSSLHRNWGPDEIDEFDRLAAESPGSAAGIAHRHLARAMSALFATQGTAWGTKDLIASMAANLAANDHGGERIGRAVTPMLQSAAREHGYKLLPRQEHPVVINTKGASASGKSTLRPLQKTLAGEIGVDWSDFAIISPDIWRKQLLDYASLGDAYKYAGAFTSDEVQIVDQKLDRYMAAKNLRGDMSHLLIDRFRFDSFAPDSNEAGSNLLTRFGQTVYLFFMITPPDMLVERAWKRGLEVGRYKAVDDTLAHAVEAYSGIPDVFFTWVRRSDKRIQFEFLDNTVRLGERPRTVAFGDNETFNILDVKSALDVERYARIDVGATAAEFLYPDPTLLLPEKNLNFLRRCVQSFHWVNFADQASGRVYLRIERGKPIEKDGAGLRAAALQPDTLAVIRSVAPEALLGAVPDSMCADLLEPKGGVVPPTLGQWGPLT